MYYKKINHFLSNLQTRTLEKIAEMSRNKNYVTENLSDYLYHQKCYKLIAIDS